MKTIMAAPKKKKVLKKKIVKKIDKPKKLKAKKVVVKKAFKKVVSKVKAKKKVVSIKATKKKFLSIVKKYEGNPIIEPRPYAWESKATFNPSAFEKDGKIHLVYRAIGDNDTSVIGYAGSHDGYDFTDRAPYAVYQRPNHFSRANFSVSPIDYISGGGWSGGCEDPRLTVIDNVVYMFYTAFDGWGSLRIAMTSIKLQDFENKKWNWKFPTLISPPGEIHKNWVLFPEKINGKFAIMHSFYPKVLIEYLDSMDELDGKRVIKSDNTRPVDLSRTWDSWFRGVGPAPIKTELGWLILYHAMDRNNADRYRMGALILDSKDPTKVLYRTSGPILEPEEDYENSGHKWGVVYSCGAVVKDGTLFVYYGGADKVVGVATVPLSDLLKELKKHKAVVLKKRTIRI